MAITRQLGMSRLTIRLQTGVNGSGGAVTQARSYSRVKPTAADADVHAVAVALGSLTEYPLYSIQRIDDAALVEEI